MSSFHLYHRQSAIVLQCIFLSSIFFASAKPYYTPSPDGTFMKNAPFKNTGTFPAYTGQCRHTDVQIASLTKIFKAMKTIAFFPDASHLIRIYWEVITIIPYYSKQFLPTSQIYNIIFVTIIILTRHGNTNSHL
jgi:hypothetical protein